MFLVDMVHGGHSIGAWTGAPYKGWKTMMAAIQWSISEVFYWYLIVFYSIKCRIPWVHSLLSLSFISNDMHTFRRTDLQSTWSSGMIATWLTASSRGNMFLSIYLIGQTSVTYMTSIHICHSYEPCKYVFIYRNAPYLMQWVIESADNCKLLLPAKLLVV